MVTEIKLSEKGYAVTWDPDSGWNLYIPTNEETDEIDPTGAALVASFMRLNSEDTFLNEQIDWLEKQVSDVSEANKTE
jgi:hypothetical protein